MAAARRHHRLLVAHRRRRRDGRRWRVRVGRPRRRERCRLLHARVAERGVALDGVQAPKLVLMDFPVVDRVDQLVQAPGAGAAAQSGAGIDLHARQRGVVLLEKQHNVQVFGPSCELEDRHRPVAHRIVQLGLRPRARARAQRKVARLAVAHRGLWADAVVVAPAHLPPLALARQRKGLRRVLRVPQPALVHLVLLPRGALLGECQFLRGVGPSRGWLGWLGRAPIGKGRARPKARAQHEAAD